ncbi:MAG: ATP-binding protein, partial [Hyphomonas sp.]|nr:ATP-binding protein [Hyphomonas sp.]
MTNPLRLIVPTTVGPSQIVYLGREDAALQRSTICLNGTSMQAGIDQEYNAFVRQPTGVVERLTGHAAFRVDVSRPIDAGSSWQLAVLTAHAAEHAGHLEQALENDGAVAGTLVWATGTVRSVNLTIGEVGHVPEKLRQSLALFEQAAASGLNCHALIPQGNRAEIPVALINQVEKLGVAVNFVSSFDEVRDILALAAPAKAEAADRSGENIWKGNPFPGLDSYGPEHRPVFFGRARAREECLAVLRKAAARDTPFLLIHGRSGVGKSSLMRAGMVGDVKRFASEGGAWTHIDIRLSNQGDPAVALVRALSSGQRQATPDEELAQSLLDDPSGFISPTIGTGDGATLLLTLDQLEQIYANGDTSSLARLERVLAGLLETGRVWIVATMRTDQLELLAETPALMRLSKAERTYVLDRPSLSETTEIIVQPLAAAGLRFDDEAKGRQLVADLAEVAIASPDSLPLLQVVLTRMADMADQGGIIPVQAYERLGGFELTAARWAETAASALLDGTVTENDLSRALGELIRIDTDTGQALSRTAPRTDATGAQAAIFDALVQARLLTVETINEATFVRLAH